ncbi:tripartite motif-containing protein 16-like [Fundulus heteroclitus]|uniref:tripartite motif-containing protein 16-like n=1 Tax=Fundulus heteroclitus TaxID=8078 RepID=UPI00165CE67F|nr:tripartite motif-containing protein 16-like [Fundulus heteroclitus]
MAQKGVELDRESFSCSICLDLLKVPVTIPCGHSYCMRCVKNFWDEEDQKRVHSCPQCRQTFTPRPVLVKNVMLAGLVEQLKLRPVLVKSTELAALNEQLKLTGLGAAPPDQSYAGPEDVACDVCSGRKLKATKSCLVCLVSYCEKHLQPHYDVARLKKHQLVEPSKQLHENICSLHDEVMKMFCRSDQQSVCYVCTVDEHKGHDIVSAAAERKEKQKELEVRREGIQQRIQDGEKDLVLLQQEVKTINDSADKAVEDNEKIFTEVIRLIQQRSSELKQQIRSQQESEVKRVKDLQEKLQQQISELQRKDAELEQLSHTEDDNQFLQSYPSLSALSEPKDPSSITVRPLRYFEDVTAAVSELGEKLQDVLRDKWTNISLRVTEVDVLLSEPEPRTRNDFLKYSQEITLDPNTAHKNLFLSEVNRKVTLVRKQCGYPDHPERFCVRYQIMSQQILSKRCYWEVEWGQWGGCVAVAYKDDYKTNMVFGYNDKSWALFCHQSNNQLLHNKIETPIPGSKVTRVGVYLDQPAGSLSFYSVSETMTLLHRVQTTFTKPLYAGIRLYLMFGDTAEICKLT